MKFVTCLLLSLHFNPKHVPRGQKRRFSAEKPHPYAEGIAIASFKGMGAASIAGAGLRDAAGRACPRGVHQG
jgi:hypothetical protein